MDFAWQGDHFDEVKKIGSASVVSISSLLIINPRGYRCLGRLQNIVIDTDKTAQK